MPSLQEILVDPNYTQANEATKKAIFDKYAGQDTNYSEANDATRLAIRQKFGLGQQIQQKLEQPVVQPKRERTWGEAATDVVAPLISGIGSTIQLPGQLYGLATGNFEKTGALGLGEDIQKYGQEMKSDPLKAMEAERARKIQEAEKTGQLSAFGTAFTETIKIPALLSSFLLEQFPQLIPALITGGGTAALTAAGLSAKEAATLVSSGVAKEAAEIAAKKAVAAKAGAVGVATAKGTGAIQQGADIGAGTYENTYKEMIDRGVPEAEAAQKALNLARVSGASGAVISLLAQKLPGASTIEAKMAGVPGKSGRIVGGIQGALGEAASEVVEEAGGKFGQNLAMREVNPEQSLTEGLGQAAGMAAIGGAGMGGVSGLARRPETLNKPQEIGKPPEGVKKPEDIAPPVRPPQAPTAKVTLTQEDLDALQNYTQGLPDNAGDLFQRMQNRDRASDASITQMQDIRVDPDYDRLKTSADFGSGAPVVISDINIPADQMGRVDVATGSDGRKIPVQYAVIDANELLVSHTVDGRVNPEYGNVTTPAIRAVAGNGRIAGLQASYTDNYAGNYRSALEGDNQHGVNPDAIAGIQNPILVRIMPQSFITPDIGDVSNTAAQLRLSPVEEAKNDGNRIDLNGLSFNEDGSINTNSVIQFVRGMPKTELGELVDKNGMPTSRAVDRLNNAIFYKAYGSDSLINLYAQAADPEAKLILAALAKAAGKVAKLDGAGEYDIRPNIIEATELAVNAKRNGLKLQDIVKQGNLGMDPKTMAILQMYADNNKSGKRMGELISNLADAAYEQSQAGEDMFGQKPKLPIEDIFKVLGGEEGGVDLFTPKEEPAEGHGFDITKSAEQIAKELDGKTFSEVTKWLVDNAPNTLAKVIAEHVQNRIEQFAQAGVNTEFRLLKGSKRSTKALGTETITTDLNPNKKHIIDPTKPARILVRINGPKEAKDAKSGKDYRVGVNYRTILHEFIHAASDVQIGFLGRRMAQTNAPQKLYDDLKSLRQQVLIQVKKDMASKDTKYNYHDFRLRMLENEDEFLAYGLTEKEFQKYLSTIKVGKQTLYSKLIEIVRKTLGLNHNYQSALEDLMRITEEGMGIEGGKLAKEVEKYYPSVNLTGKVSAPSVLIKPKSISSKKETVTTKEMKIPSKEDIYKKTGELLQKRPPLKPESFEGVPDDFMNAANPVFAPQKKTIVDRINGMRDNFWKKLAQGMADQFRTIKEYSPVAYMLARLSKSVDGALEGLMMFGEVFNDGGALNIRPNTKGLIEVLKPLGNEVDRFNMWKALTRESQLPADKRSRFINEQGKDVMPKLVAERDKLIEGDLNGKPRKQVYEQVRKDMQKLNESVLKVALEMGLIDSTAKMIGRIREQIDFIQNKESLSDNAKNKQIQELEDQIADLEKNPIGYERFVNDINYIPFYREMEDGDIDAVMTASSLTNQHFSKALKGGESPFADLMENTLRNWSHILSASMKAQAAHATIEAAIPLGGAEPNLKQQFVMVDGLVNVITRKKDEDGNIYESSEVYKDGKIEPWMTTPASGKSGKSSIKIMVDGSPAYYNVLDPMLLDSISSIGYLGPKSKFLDVARDFKNMLQFGVTISPAFKVRNLIRDSIQAMAVSDLKKDPFTNIVDGWASSDKNNPAHISALAGGGVFTFGTHVEGDQAKLVKRLVAQGVKEEHILDTPDKIKKGLRIAFDKYQEWGNKSEAANRMALYNQMKAKNMSHLEASFYARDLLDFSMSGSWPAFRQVCQVVPFLNARVQGLYKLGRDGIMPTSRVFYNTITGQPIDQTDQQKAASFSIVTSAVCLASLALYFAFKDDDEFKKRDEWDRDNFWWFKLPGMDYALRVPKPFEIGAFGTIAERVAEQIFDKGAEGKQFQQSMGRMVTDTFAVNLPQFVKPLVDLYANKDSFTGAPIESAGMERLSKQERAADTTSPLAKLLGGISSIAGEGLSPVQMDYAIKAYFGWLGSAVAESSHYAVMPFKDGSYPDTKVIDKLSVGLVKSLPSNQSKYPTAFYDSNKQISQALADMRHYAEIGDSEKAMKILEEKGDKIALAKFYDKTAKNMAKIRQQISLITNDTNMDGATKREEIDRMKELISMLAEQAEQTRKSMKQ